VQKEDATGQLHALGKVEAREGEQSLAVCFFLTDNSQAGNLAGMQRCTTLHALITQQDMSGITSAKTYSAIHQRDPSILDQELLLDPT